MTRSALFPVAVIASLALATAAQAHPKLLSSTPADKSTVASTSRIVMHFSEALEVNFSGADLVMTSMMMNGQMTAMPMTIGKLAASADPADAKTLVLTTKSPLEPGGYRLNWHAVSVDTHRVTGVLTFKVQ